MNTILRHLRRLALGAGLSDSQLLGSFVERREEAAFAALVQRHGPMVFGVCRRLLGNQHDAEDAFQATFLVLVRKAAHIRAGTTIGNWLYGVACRTALRARAMNAKRRFKEQTARERFVEVASAPNGWDDLLPLVDEELSRLPDKYRAPVVLCDLEGKSRAEAARLLGWPVGTLSWRLAAARKSLAAKLTRRGIALSAGAMLTAMGQQSLAACVPGALVAATTRAALLLAAGPAAAVVGVVSAKVLTLTEGVLKTMFLAKITSASGLFAGVAVLGLTTGGFFYQTRAGTDDSAQPREAKAAAAAEPQRDQPARRLDGDRRDEEMRRALEEARRHEQELRVAVESLRKQLEDTRAELDRTRKMGEGVRYFNTVAQQVSPPRGQPPQGDPTRGRAGPDDRTPRGPDGNTPRGPGRNVSGVRHPEGDEAAALTRIQERRHAIQDELKRLDEQQRQVQEQMARRRDEMRRQPQGVGGPDRRGAGQPQGDRLDQLMQRLEQIERRLQQLEQNRPGSRRD